MVKPQSDADGEPRSNLHVIIDPGSRVALNGCDVKRNLEIGVVHWPQEEGGERITGRPQVIARRVVAASLKAIEVKRWSGGPTASPAALREVHPTVLEASLDGMFPGEPGYIVKELVAVVGLKAIRPRVPVSGVRNVAGEVDSRRSRFVGGSRQARDPQLGHPAHTIGKRMPAHGPAIVRHSCVVEYVRLHD